MNDLERLRVSVSQRTESTGDHFIDVIGHVIIAETLADRTTVRPQKYGATFFRDPLNEYGVAHTTETAVHEMVSQMLANPGGLALDALTDEHARQLVNERRANEHFHGSLIDVIRRVPILPQGA